MSQPLADRFWSHVDVRGPDDCWPWTAHTNDGGYGRVRVGPVLWLAHRLAWFLRNGPIPEGQCALHSCDNPPCCNPAHVFLGTRLDNNEDRDKKGRGNYAQRRGAGNANAKLTEQDVLEIRALGALQPAHRIADRFGVSPSHVRRIVTGEKWSHLVPN